MKRIVLAMSGGVDSSVSAHLLQQEGWEVIGVTLDLWRGEVPSDAGPKSCCAAAAEDARRVCQKLGLPHYTLNCRDEFRRLVIDDFCEEYFRGRTPNPCIRCNERIKGDHLLDIAAKLGAEAIATGHYAIVDGPDARGRFLLRKGMDAAKDQSYVLYGLRQNQLARIRFPLGTWEKRQVRRLARELGLSTHNKPDSQEICFVPDNDYGEFLKRVAPDRIRPGRIVDTSGKEVGPHAGIHLFTLGQRKGLRVAFGKPRYVLRIDPDTATVVIGTREQTLHTAFLVRDVNWITLENPATPLEAEVKIRYTHHPVPARVEPMPAERAASAAEAARVTLAAPESAITPGQAAVFYQFDLVLGGGTIDQIL